MSGVPAGPRTAAAESSLNAHSARESRGPRRWPRRAALLLGAAGISVAALTVAAGVAKRRLDHRRANPPPIEGQTIESLRAFLADHEAWVAFVREQSASYPSLRLDFYRVRPGDNFWKVSAARGTSIHTIVGANPALPDLVARTGQELVLLAKRGCLHLLQAGERLADLATRYGTVESEIARANGVTERDLYWGIRPGTLVFVPGARPQVMTPAVEEKYRIGQMLASPLAGRYTSFKGTRVDPITGDAHFHNGVDLAVPRGTWVGSAADGRVSFAGVRGGYGKCIVIRHDNGFETLYGHLHRIHVKPGQRVRRGQLIARSGSTGRSTGPHLHFTVWKGGKLVPPQKYISIW